MKRLMMILFVVAMSAVNTKAQEKQPPPPKKTPEERATNMTERMTKALALNPDQQQKVKALILQREKDRDAAVDKVKGSREKMEQQMDTDMQKILSSEQFEKYKKKREEMKKKREERKGGPGHDDDMPPPPPPQK